MTKKVTIHDIARKLNITASTVSRALNDHPKISKKTKKLVQQTAEKLGYERNTIASALRSGTSKLVGVIVPNIDRSFFSSIISGIEKILNPAGYHVIITQSHESLENEISNMETLLNTQVDGILMSISKETFTYDHIENALKKGRRIIFFDRIIEQLPVASVVVDDFNGAYQAVKQLIEQGYKRIAHFSVNPRISVYRDRFRGYKSALEDHNIPVIQEYILEVANKEESGVAAIKQLLEMPNPPDAVFSSSDFSALGAMQYLIENDIKIPENIGLWGFSNEPFTKFLTPPLSSVDQNSSQMGETVAKVFLDQVNNDEKTDQGQKIVLKPQLKIRRSSTKVEIINTHKN
jgi:LacI family transcriptional regulator